MSCTEFGAVTVVNIDENREELALPDWILSTSPRAPPLPRTHSHKVLYPREGEHDSNG